MMKNKLGGIEINTIIRWIILIVSVILILLIFTNIGLTPIRDEELCRVSVATRSSAILSSAKNLVSLNCKTRYICFSVDGTCEEMASPDETIKIKTKEELFYNLAELMRRCWNQYGKGAGNYIGEGLDSNLYCSICYQIAFDDSIQEIVGGTTLDKQEYMNYLSNTNISDTEKTYAEYIYTTNKVNELATTSLTVAEDTKTENNTAQVESVCSTFCTIQDAESYCIDERVLTLGDSKTVGTCYAFSKSRYGISECEGLCSTETSLDLEIISTKTTSGTPEKITIDMGKIDLTKQHYIMMGIFNEISVLGWTARGAALGAAGALGAAIAVLSGGTALPVSISIITLVGGAVGGVGNYFVATTIKGDSGQQFMTPTIIEAGSDAFNSLNCESIVSLSD